MSEIIVREMTDAERQTLLYTRQLNTSFGQPGYGIVAGGTNTASIDDLKVVQITDEFGNLRRVFLDKNAPDDELIALATAGNLGGDEPYRKYNIIESRLDTPPAPVPEYIPIQEEDDFVPPPIEVRPPPAPPPVIPPPPPLPPAPPPAPPAPPRPRPSSYYLQVRLGVYAPPPPAQKRIDVNLDIRPAVPTFLPFDIEVPWTLELKPIPLALTDAVLAASRRLLDGKIPAYFDQDRVGKTLLNFGNDFQSVILNWKYDEQDSTRGTILVKLYQPLPPEIELFTELWIARELSPTYLDQIFVVFVPGEGLKVYLRPPNRDLNVRAIDGNEVNNVTLQSLLTSGSTSKTDLTDPVMEEWFITSLEGAELNIDYSNYKNFVFYSSAVKRLEAFRQKLLILEDYNQILAEQSASIAAATSGMGVTGFTGSLAYGGYQRISEQRLDLIRSFDGYERFLYYGSGSAYSSSFSDDGGAVDQLYYLVDATWPKVSGSLISVASASNVDLYSVGGTQFAPDGDYEGLVSWWDAITYIASEYDRQNQNRLANNLPEYLVTDSQSSDFLTFVDMIGHHFDVLKSYADAMPFIFDRDNDPSVKLSPDMVWNIAASFGIELPNQYAVKNLVDYTIGEIGNVSPKVYREIAAETWKRFLHNQVYLLKSKGTKSALRGLLNTYGVLPTTIQIRETATPSFYTTQSYELIEEQTNTLDMVNNSYVQIPFSGTALPGIETVQVRFATTTVTQSVLFNVDNAWAVRIEPFSSSFARVALVNSGGTSVASSSLFRIFDGNYYSVTVQRDGLNAALWTQRADEDGDIVDSSFVTASLGTWFSGSNFYLGASGSTFGASFIGQIDEVRLWSEKLTSGNINLHVQYPALYNGNTTTSARDNLPVRLSFNKPRNLGTPTASLQFVLNESPYIREPNRSPVYTQFSASGFPNESEYPFSMTVVTRTVLRYSPNSGGNQFVSNKIVVADPPVLRYLSDDSGSGVPVLSHEKSMVTVDQKFDNVQSNNIIGFYFSPTDAINDSIIRTIGNVDLQDYIGNPEDLYADGYSSLNALNELYWTYYAYAYNYNSFVEFVENLLQPLFVQARKLVPARAKLLTGLVLESPILERNKIKYNKLDTSGLGTFEEEVTPTLYPDALTSQPAAIESVYPVYEVTFDKNTETEVESVLENEEATIEMMNTSPIDAEYALYDVTYDLNDIEEITASAPTYDATVNAEELGLEDIEFEIAFFDDETARLNYEKFLLERFNAASVIQVRDEDKPYFNQLLETFRPKSRVPVQTGMNPNMADNFLIQTIEPYVDFLDISVTNYFMQVDGLFLIPTQVRVRIGENVLVPAGEWVKGTTYVANQYVTQSNQTGAAEAGNGFEYVCVTSAGSGSFISYNPPSLDTDNWRKIRYTFVETNTIRVATDISGTIQLVASGSGYTPFTGYNDKHYRFVRDTRLGTLRRIWLGCKQSDDTTPDGGPAVEIIPSAGDVLVVSTGAEPIQRGNDNAGPILNVR